VVLERRDSTVRIAVHDVSRSLPVQGHPLISDEGGRGITLVASLSADWGSELLAEGKIVWSELQRTSR
jgi:hypothetical protein